MNLRSIGRVSQSPEKVSSIWNSGKREIWGAGHGSTGGIRFKRNMGRWTWFYGLGIRLEGNMGYITSKNDRKAKYFHTAVLPSADALFGMKLRVHAYTDKFVEPLQKVI
jgi:hypothetical protein